MKLWIVGKYVRSDLDNAGALAGAVWEFQGVYDDRQKAVDACRPGYFVGSAVLNEAVSDEPRQWPDCEYPKG